MGTRRYHYSWAISQYFDRARQEVRRTWKIGYLSIFFAPRWYDWWSVACLAEFDTGDGPRLNNRLVGAAVGLEGLFHRIYEVLLLQVAGTAGCSRVRVVDLLQYLHFKKFTNWITIGTYGTVQYLPLYGTVPVTDIVVRYWSNYRTVQYVFKIRIPSELDWNGKMFVLKWMLKLYHSFFGAYQKKVNCKLNLTRRSGYNLIRISR